MRTHTNYFRKKNYLKRTYSWVHSQTIIPIEKKDYIL